MSDDSTKVRKLAEKARFGMLTTLDETGSMVSRPMTVQEIDDQFTLLFITQRGNDAAVQSDGKPVNLSFADGGAYVSIAGRGELRDDVEKKKELWNPANDAYTEGGPENPDNVILAVRADSAEYWDSPSAPVQAISMLAALVTGDKPAGGEHGTVVI